MRILPSGPLFALALALTLAVTTQATLAAPSAQDLLARTRFVSALAEHDLKGILKKNSLRVPVKIFMRGKDIQLQYLAKDQKGWQGVHLQLNPQSCELYDVGPNEMTPFPTEKIGASIAGTDLSYEDLSLRFLYWPNPTIVGEDRVMTQDCYKIRVDNPDGRGNYQAVYLWIHKKAAALMKVEAYDRAGQHIKTFQAVDLMRVGGDMMMKRMKVEARKGGKVKNVSYLIFEDPDPIKKRSGPRKLR